MWSLVVDAGMTVPAILEDLNVLKDCGFGLGRVLKGRYLDNGLIERRCHALK